MASYTVRASPSLESAATVAGRRGGQDGAAVAGTIVVSGVGSVGSRHVANLIALGHRDLLLHRSGRGTPGRPLPDLPTEDSLDRALDRGPLAVVVTNPTALHVQVAVRAARAGAHLFLEKPVSDSLESARALAREVGERGLVALVGYQFRFHPALRRIRAWLEASAVGEVVSARAHWGESLRRWHPREDYRRSYSGRRDLGGGVIRTLSHPFDYLRFLLGDVVAVSADVDRRSGLEIDVEDVAAVTLRFRSGALGSVYLDYVTHPKQHGLEIVGRQGRISWEESRQRALLFDAQGRRVEAFRPPVGFERNTLFLDEMAHFLRCLAGTETPACSLADGVAALSICEAALRSAEEKRAVPPLGQNVS